MTSPEQSIKIDDREVIPTTVKDKPALNVRDSAGYLGITETALNNNIKRWNAVHSDSQIEKRQWGFGPSKYLWIEDLDRLRDSRME